MVTRLSLRLSAEQENRIAALSSAASDGATDSHAIYLELMAALPGARSSGRGDAARQHRKLLTQKLHSQRRRKKKAATVAL